MSDKVNKKVLLPRFILDHKEEAILEDIDPILALTYCQPEDDICGIGGRVEHIKVLSLIRDKVKAFPRSIYEIPYIIGEGMYLRRVRILVNKQRIPVVELMEDEVTPTSISYYITDALRKVISLYIGREISPTSIVF